MVNSYAWDTAVMFIQKCSDKTTYWDDYDEDAILNDTGATTDNPCNIYDMAGNLCEWTTEYSSYSNIDDDYYSCVTRGGFYNNGGYCTAGRYYGNATISVDALGFRAVLSCSPVS